MVGLKSSRKHVVHTPSQCAGAKSKWDKQVIYDLLVENPKLSSSSSWTVTLSAAYKSCVSKCEPFAHRLFILLSVCALALLQKLVNPWRN